MHTITTALVAIVVLASSNHQPSLLFKVDDSLQLEGDLLRPEGPGPFPAVVLMHGCSGATSAEASAAKFLRDSGYVTFTVYSFTRRNVRSTCADSSSSPTPRERVADAFAARRYLATLPYVDPARVALAGWSAGGITALMAWAKNPAGPASERFAAVATYYPYCAIQDDTSGVNVPLLVMSGEADDWCPASLCQAYVSEKAARGLDVTFAKYAGATHAFDAFDQDRGTVYNGHVMKGDREATRDSRQKLLAFLGRAMK